MLNISSFVRSGVAVVSLAAALVPIAGTAQIGPVVPVITIPCCRCLDGRQSVNISTGTAAWRVSSPNSTAIQAVVPASNPAWTSLAPAAWVAPPGAPNAVGDYTYVLRFRIPRCTIPSRVMITGSYAADNSARVFLNANQISASQGTPNFGFLPGSVTNFSSGPLTAGPIYTLRVIVRNSSGPTGFVMRAAVNATCVGRPEAGGPAGDAAADRSDQGASMCNTAVCRRDAAAI